MSIKKSNKRKKEKNVDVVKFLNSNNIKFEKIEQHYNMDCFLCEDSKKRMFYAHDKVNENKWMCHKCGNSGTKFSTFKYAWEHKDEIKANKERSVRVEEKEKCSIKPEFHKTFSKVVENHEKYKLGKKVVKYMVKERKLSLDTLKHFQVGGRSKFKSKKGKIFTHETVAIPYIRDGKCVNLKYRSLDPESDMKWTREKGGISALFNDAVIDNLDYEEIVIVESEIDCMSMHELGIKNTVGLTVGAKGFKESWYDRLLRFKKVYLLLDNDEAGEEGAEALARRLGMGRCYNITLPSDVKDPNDFIKKYKKEDFLELKKSASLFNVDKVESAHNVMDQLYDELVLGKKTEDHADFEMPWRRLNDKVGPVKKGFLFVLAGKPKAGKCVKWDSTVYNPYTLVPATIEQAVKEKWPKIWSYDEEAKKFVIGNVVGHYDSGVKDMIRVRTANGRSIDTTYEHRYLTFDGWKKVSELEVGEKIAVPSTIPFFGSNTCSKERLFVTAALLADGSLKGCFRYTKKDAHLVKSMGEALDTEFNCSLKPINNYDYNIVGNQKNVNPCLNFIRINGMDELSKHKKIPSFIYSLDQELIKYFIGVLWSHDGSIYQKDGRTSIEYTSASEELIDGLNHLLIRFGINTIKRERKVKLNGKEHQAYCLSSSQAYTVEKFTSTIPLFGEKASRVVTTSTNNKIARDYLMSFPKTMWDVVKDEAEKSGLTISALYRLYVGKEVGYKGHRFKTGGPISKHMLSYLNKFIRSELIEKWVSADISFVEVEAVEDIGKHQCYDLTVDKYHNFLSNDILAHNTTMALNLMKYWGKKGINCGMFTGEMRPKRITEKWLRMEIYTDDLMGTSPVDFKLARFNTPTRRLHMHYPETPDDLELENACNKIEEMVQRFGCEVIVVDNLHFLCRGDDENAMVSMATQAFKLLAERLNILLILITHPRKQITINN